MFPSSFVILPFGCFFRSLLWGLWSFTRWTLGSRLPGACLLPADPDNFSSQFTQLRLAGERLGSQCRWRHRGGRGVSEKTGEVTAALLAETTGHGVRTLHMSVSRPVLGARFPGNKLKWLWSRVVFISLSSPPPRRTLKKELDNRFRGQLVLCTQADYETQRVEEKLCI